MSMTAQNNQVFSMSMGSGYIDPRSGPNFMDPVERNQYYASRGGMPGAGGASGGGGGNARVDAARNEMYGLARGNLKDLKGDPVDAMVRAQLMKRANGGSLPYDQATQNAMLVKQANLASAAQRAQASRIRGNPNDPSYRAAMSELNANRQGANQDARLNIAQNANVANYNAQGSALGQLGQFQGAYHDRVTGASNYLSGLLSNESADSPSGGGAGGAGGAAGGSFRQVIGTGGHGTGPGGSIEGGSSAASGFDNDSFFKTRAGSGGSSGVVYGTGPAKTAADVAAMDAYNRRVNPSYYKAPTFTDYSAIVKKLGNAGPFNLG